MWALWWVWVAAGLVLAILEVFAPGFIFLGFAVGAGMTGLLLAIGLSFSLPVLLVVFALITLVAWLVMRKVFGVKSGNVKTFDHDINER